ncbi:hypothetical protein [Paenibacillus pinisoli]|uniref:hypothetical protein n=1 Tax=Paenibacillus pinisoli TaxID=1276110 RepID=UPI001058861B|nr:hypothetical protein [Paenibacillus pinisoli]
MKGAAGSALAGLCNPGMRIAAGERARLRTHEQAWMARAPASFHGSCSRPAPNANRRHGFRHDAEGPVL